MRVFWIGFPVVWLVWLAVASPCAAMALERFEFERPKMGAPWRVIVYTEDRIQAERAADAVFARVDQLTALMSDYDSQSELSRLSAASRHKLPTESIRVSGDLWRVLERSLRFSQQTCGAFDVTVGPYVRLWRRSRQQGLLPSPERLASTRTSVGYEKLWLDAPNQSVQLLAPDMWLDLGGIAVGYAADEALRVLARAGIRDALVDAGGDIVAVGAPPGSPGWRVGLAECAAEQESDQEFIWLQDGAIATSGDSYRYVEIDGQRYSHVIDPKTGLGLTNRLIVSVCAPDCMTADGLSTAISVLGIEKGLALAGSFPGVSVRICDMQFESAKVYTTENFPKRWTADKRDGNSFGPAQE